MTTSSRSGAEEVRLTSRSTSLTRRGMGAVMLATVFSAASGYVVMLLAGRQLGAAGYADFTVYWALFFTFVGITYGMMQESTRAVSSEAVDEPDGARTDPADANVTGASTRQSNAQTLQDTPGRADPVGHATATTSPAIVAAGVGLVLALLITATSPLWAARVIPEHEVLGIAVLAISVWTVAIQTTLWGLASGRGRWSLYAWAHAVDAAVRLAVAVWAVATGHGIIAFVFATVGGAISWIMLMSTSSARTTLTARVRGRARAFLHRSIHAMAASAATSVLIVGFPVLLAGTDSQDLGAEAGSLLFAVMITRAPLLVPLTSFQSAIIVYFVERRSTMITALLLPIGATIVVGAVGAALAWWIGPPLIRLVGEGFDMSGGALAALVAGAMCTAALMLTGSATLAAERHRSYAVGWWSATGLAIVLLAMPMSLTERTVTALVIGPLTGVLIHMTVVVLSRSAARHGARYDPDPVAR